MKNNNASLSELLNPQGLLVCPVCGKDFKANDDTKYLIGSEYTCSWKCFLNDANRRELERKENENTKKNKK